MLGLYDWVIAWDHRLGTAWIVSTGLPGSGAERAPGRGSGWRWCRRGSRSRRGGRGGSAGASERRPEHVPPSPADAPSYPVLGVDGAAAIGLRSTFTHRGYLDAVARVREYIVAGDIFQANLSQRLQAPLGEPPFELYRRSGGGIRRRSPPISASTTSRC